MAKKIELLHTTYDESGNIESQEVVHPLTSPDCIIMENGKTLDEVMGDGIATPTLTHEGTSFKVGVGDSNIEVVDGDVAGMTLKGQSYQNILPKPTTLIMETDEKEFKINDKIDSNIIIDDNIAEIATVKGKTIVNTVQEESGSEYTVLGEDLSGQSIVTTNKPEGNIKGVTLQGQTLVNTIQEPCEDDYVVLGADDGIEISAETGGHGTIEDTVQGGINGAVLEGQTLVNLMHPSSLYNISTGDVADKNEETYTSLKYIVNQDATQVNLFRYVYLNPVYNNMFKPATKYFILYDELSDNDHVKELTIKNFNSQPALSIRTKSQKIGKGKFIVTTEDDVTEALKVQQVLVFEPSYQDYTTGEVIHMKNVRIFEYQEGMENWDIPYFEGMKSVQMPVVKTTGKNLISYTNDNKMVNTNQNPSDIIYENGGFKFNVSDSDWKSVWYDLNLKPNTTYTITYTTNFIGCFVYKSKVNTYISTEMLASKGQYSDNEDSFVSPKLTFTTDSKGFIRIRFTNSTTNGHNIIKDIQLEEGSTATSYEPYKSSTLTTGKLLLTLDMIEQGSFFDSFELNTQTYEYIKVPSTNTDFYATRIRSKGTFKVHGGDKYIFNLNTNYAITLGFCKNGLYSAKNGSWITNGTTITVPSDCNEMFFAIKKTSDANIVPSEFSGVGLEIKHLVTLHKVGDVQDELDLSTGKLTQRVGEIVLDGTTYTFNQTPAEVIGDNVVGGWSGIYGINAPKKTSLSISSDIPTRIYTSDGNPYEDKEYFMVGINTMILSLSKTRLNGKTIAQYLASNPITVQYELETPIIKTIDLQVTDQDGNTIPHIQTQPNITHITASSDYLIPTVTINGNLVYDTIIKPSTLYTIRFNHDTVNADNPLTVDLGGTTQTVTSTEFTITTPSELTHNQLVFSGKNNVVSEVQVIEGDVVGTQYPFFEGMSDVKSPKLLATGTGKNLLNPSILNPIITNSTKNYAGVSFTYNSDGSFTMSGTFTNNITLHGNADEFIKLLKHGVRYRTSEMMLMEVFSLDGDTRWTNDLTFDKNNHIRVSPYYQWNGIIGESINKTYYPQVEIGDSQTSYEPYKGVEVQQDVDSIPLTSDMFEQGNIASGKIVGMSYQQLSHNTETIRVKSKTLIPIKPNGKYIIQSLNKTNNRLWGWQYDKNGGYLSSIGNTDEIDVFQFDSKAHYITFVLCNQNDSAISPSDLDSMNLILQEVPQEIVLRGIGDVKDELDLTRGEYIQRIGEIKLIDQKGIASGSKTSETWFEALVYLDDYIKVENNGITKIINNKLPLTSDANSATTSYLRNNAGANNYIVVALTVEDMGGLTGYDGWHYYVKNNDVVIQYELETPIIHKVNLTNTKVIPSYATETHYETVTPSDSLIPNITIPSTLNYDVAIKSSTEYTIRANTSDNLTVDLGGATGTLSNGKVTLTTPTTLTHNEVKFSGTGKVKELMVVEGNEIKDNVPFFNGMKDVQMGGIKLVNVCRGMYTWNTGFITLNTNYNQITFTDKGSYGNIQFDETLLKSHTTYTVYFNITENTSTITSPIGVTLSQTNGKETSTHPIISAKQTGIMSFTITTDEVAKTPRFVVKSGSTDSKITIKNIMIIEGDWTHLDEIPFIESEMIIEQPIIRSQGKNLLDLESKSFTIASEGTTFAKSGNTYTVTTPANSMPYDYIRRVWTVNNDKWLKDVAGKKLTLSVSSISCTNSNSMACIQLRIECMDGTKYYPGIHNGGKAVTFNMPINVKNLQMQVMTNNTGAVLTEDAVLTISGIQLELGDTATSYKAYRHQTLYSNRVIGYEDGCYYVWDTGTKTSSDAIASVISDVEGLNVAYVTHASSNFSFYDKDGVYLSGSMFLSTATSSYTNDNFDKNGFITIPANAKYMKMACGNASSAAAKDYHLKATVTGELPLRSLPNGVCDTLNLVTGEYVQRVGEVVLDGSEDWNFEYNGLRAYTEVSDLIRTDDYRGRIICDGDYIITSDHGGVTYYNHPILSGYYDGNNSYPYSNWIYVGIPNITSSEELKQHFTENPLTIQYQLATPIVRKLGFTTKGNYREQVLDGSETWVMDAIDNNTTVRMTKKTTNPLQNALYNTPLFTDDYHVRAGSENHSTYEYITCIGNGIYINIYQSKVKELSIQGCTQWLSQNPIKVGYITSAQSSESYSNIHKPIFFNNANVQFLPNNVDIQPELTYQVRTRNSYVMDMMKPNTKYSVKLLLNTGEFVPTIDGVNNPLVNGRTFTSPSTLTNKLLITPCIKELMIIEGDVTGKNLPYFKGILSSYHDVDEIELYSVNKNLFDMSKVKPFEGRATYWWNTIVKENEVVSVRIGDINNGQFGAYIKLNVRPNSTYTLYIEMEKDGEPYNGQIYGYENGDLWGNGTFTGYANTPYHIKTSHNAKYITIGLNYGKDFPIGTTLVSKNMRLYLGEESPVYIPHTHSTTLIEMPTRLETVKVVRPVMEKGCILNNNGAAADSPTEIRLPFIPVQPGEILSFRNGNDYRAMNVHVYDINNNFIKHIYTNGTGDLIVPDNCYFIRGFCRETDTSDLTITRQAYKPIQLNSLPNGVYDEIIMKPNSNKAQLVQRVGKVVLDGNAPYYKYDINSNAYCQWYTDLPNAFAAYVFSDTLPTFTERTYMLERGISGKGGTGKYVWFNIESAIATTESTLKPFLQQNPITVYYELATPIIHEIQLKGYPHVYENGTVTLNTDIPHKTLVSYNVNQEQLISNQNETIIRHDQQIDDLYYYIEMYLEEIYQMELFRMKLELSL